VSQERSILDEVVERINTRLGRWKGRLISMAGRIYLIKSVLSAIPLFYMSLFKIPAVVVKKIVKIQRNFLWGWGSGERKIVWTSWEKVCEPHEAGGLGVINIKPFNIALLGKWIWRMSYSKGSLWKEVLTSKYGGWRNLKVPISNKNESLWWRELMVI